MHGGISTIKTTFFKPSIAHNVDGLNHFYELDGIWLLTRLILNKLGLYQLFVLSERSMEWAIV